MKKPVLLLFAFLMLASCTTQKPFDGFYHQHKKHVKLAIAVPKYIANIFVPKDEKSTVNKFTKGLKRVKLLIDEDEKTELADDFDRFVKSGNYDPYIYYNSEGEKIQLLVNETDELIREVVFRAQSEEMTVIMALQGKMKKDRFEGILEDH